MTAGRSGGASVDVAPARRCRGGIALFGYLCVCLNALFFGYLFVTDPEPGFRLAMKEDAWIEDLTVIWLLLASLLLLATASVERRSFPRCLYILGGIAFVFAAGEEINWGQRIFDFDAPDNLMGLLDLDIEEFSVHNNIDLASYLIFWYGGLGLCTITCVAFFSQKDALLGIPLPSIPLMLGFLVTLSHVWSTDEGVFTDVFTPEKELLLLLVLYTLFSTRQVRLIVAPIATLALSLAIMYIFRPDRSNVVIEELWEYLFGLCCLFYSLELLLAQEPASRMLSTVAGLKLPGGRMPSLRGVERRSGSGFGLGAAGKPGGPLWLAAYSLVIAGSIWLALLEYFNGPAAAFAPTGKASRAITSAEPIRRSNFDVYLDADKLIYVKEECGRPEDIGFQFFLHVYPVDRSDLPDRRRRYGFDNLDFDLRDAGFFDTRRCVAVRDLPGYRIADIRTGQFVTQSGRKAWEVRFTSNE